MTKLARTGAAALALCLACVLPGYAGGSGNHAPAGYLGVDVRDAAGDAAGRAARGAEIVRLDHDGPAAKAGVREHDIVTMVNGQPVEGEESIRRMLRELPAGHTVALVIGREGQSITVTTQMANREVVEHDAWERHMTVPEPVYGFVLPGEQPAPEPVPGGMHPGRSFLGSTNFTGLPYTGAMLEVVGAQLAGFFGASNGSGLLVHSVEANSPAAMAGMRAGDLVVRANTQTLASTSDWTRVLRESHGRPVAITVLRDRKEAALTLVPAGHKHIDYQESADPSPASLCVTTL